MDEGIFKYNEINSMLDLFIPISNKIRSYNTLMKLLYKENIFEDNIELEEAAHYFISEYYSTNSEFNNKIKKNDVDKILEIYQKSDDIKLFLQQAKKIIGIPRKRNDKISKYKNFNNFIEKLYNIDFFKNDIGLEFKVLDSVSKFYFSLNKHDKTFEIGSAPLLENWLVYEEDDLESYVIRARKSLDINLNLNLFEIELVKSNLNLEKNRFEYLVSSKFLETTPLWIQGVDFEFILEEGSSKLFKKFGQNKTSLNIDIQHLEYFNNKLTKIKPIEIINSLNGQYNTYLTNNKPIESIYNSDLIFEEFELNRIYFIKSKNHHLDNTGFIKTINNNGRLQISNFNKSNREKAINDLINNYNYKSNSNTIKLTENRFKKEYYITEINSKIPIDKSKYYRLEIKLIKESGVKWNSVYVFGTEEILKKLLNSLNNNTNFYGLSPDDFQLLYIEFIPNNDIDNLYLQNMIDEFNIFEIESNESNYEDLNGKSINYFYYLDLFGDGVNLDLDIKHIPSSYMF